MNMTSKDYQALKMKDKRMRAQIEALGKIDDWKNRKAKESFLRPAFKWTDLEVKND